MNNKALKVLITAVQFLIAFALAYLCAEGILKAELYQDRMKFVGCLLRILSILAFTICYYHSLTSGFGVDSLFVPLHLFFSILSEIRILYKYSTVFYVHYLAPVQIVDIFILSVFMNVLPLIGYCIFFDNVGSSGVGRFISVSFVGSVLMTILLPKAQNFSDLFRFKVFYFLIYIIYVVAALVCIISLITDTPGQTVVRHIILLLLLTSSYINLFYDTFILNIIGTAFIITVTFIVIVMSRRNAIKL